MMRETDRTADGSAVEPSVVVKLALNSIYKSFDLTGGRRLDAIVDVSFDVLENELCVLLGPSGCGKSTLLRILAGLETPTSGTAALDGETISGAGRERGMVFQSYTSFEWLTVFQNVEYGMKLNRVPKQLRRERADHFIELVGLTKFRDTYPRQLSGGMKQRVAIARTLANEPALLLMDEPFGALDAETRWNMQELLISILEETETTVVLVTHDIEEAIFLADKIVFLRSHPGTVQEVIIPEFKNGQRTKTKEELYNSPSYPELERHVMHLMRKYARQDP